MPFPELKALVLAGGIGSRLKTILPSLPKCLAPVLGRPFLAYQLEWLESAGFSRICLCTGYLADQVFDAFGDRFCGINIEYSPEPEPLGTGGAVRLALERYPAAEDFLVLNGDSFLEFDLEHLREAFARSGRAATMALAKVSDTSRFGRVEVAQDSSESSRDSMPVQRFLEKGLGGPGLINAGIYCLSREDVGSIPLGMAYSLEKDLFPSLVQRGRLLGVAGGGRFIDIGTPDSYSGVDSFFLDGGRFLRPPMEKARDYLR